MPAVLLMGARRFEMLQVRCSDIQIQAFPKPLRKDDVRMRLHLIS